MENLKRDPLVPPSESDIVDVAIRAHDMGMYVIPWGPNKPAMTYSGYPERAFSEVERIIRQNNCKRLTARLSPQYVVFDCDRDFEQGAEAVYSVLGLRRGLEVRSPNGLHIWVRRPLGARILTGENKLKHIGIHAVDVFTSEGNPITLPGSWKTANAGKAGGHYEVTFRPSSMPVLTPNAIRLLKPPVVRNPPRYEIKPRDGRSTNYGQTALNNIIRDVANSEPGTRQPTLYKSAARLGGLIANGQLPHDKCKTALFDAAVANGLVSDIGEPKTRDTITRAIQRGYDESA